MDVKERRRCRLAVRQPRASYYAWKKEEVEKVLDLLRRSSSEGVPVIVEGRKDEAALRKLAVSGRVLCLKARRGSRLDFVEQLDGFDRVIVLTDFDREGRELRDWLYHELSRLGVKTDDTLWRRVKALSRSDVRSVEELPSFIRALEARAMGRRL
ncbi:hypothetical protein E6H36_05765 [Candidatus Bathyarchaeota archaeon]|nr:MAG: hypothetical protein E6H36_05765 [Candidatus Bathyarchaeota archaeon]